MVSCPFFLGYPSIVKKRSNGLDGKLPFLPQLPFHHKETATNKATDFMVPFHGYPSILKKRGCKQSNRLDAKLPSASWRNVSYVFMWCFHAVDPWCVLLQRGVLGWKWRWWGWWSCFPFALQACGAVTLSCRALVFSDSACNQELIISGHFPNTVSGLLLMLYASCE